ncbi:ABC transporter ATP-binding protein [Yinghuangia sp. ASG 101]|uniref:dipeptide ABC transporter ATP-binding protein n=1 Tax=Yinghuangia sp. ASG 101 TaxID=2896848 RepID=UPI001E5FFAFA|nr:ABC transporter ATP-binding protein [Yinghuangia sp. ASG 101]UGQ09841.1 ABC transporter ATP-binding protein [Yinghuangia sp. ASG 101]
MTVSTEKPQPAAAGARSGTAAEPPSAAPLLRVRGLHVTFDSERGPVHAVRGVDFDLARGETLAIVGESGSGKSTTALALTRMLPPAGRISAGAVLLDNGPGDPLDLTAADEAALRRVRGARVGMIFQDPMTSLNPLLTVGRHLDEAMRAHGVRDKRARTARAVELLDLVGIPDPAKRMRDHPHQFSGGMRQRVMIALALANEPDLLLADEPTTALDPTVQAQILDLIERLSRDLGTATVLITHNMGVVARSAARVMVLYGGKVVEQGRTADVLTAPHHPYTAGLLRAVPRLDAAYGQRLRGIPGAPPDLAAPPAGCAFADRCTLATDQCRTEQPPSRVAAGRTVACWVSDGPVPDAAAESAAKQAPSVVARAAGTGDADGEPVVSIRSLGKVFRSRRNRVVALDDVSLDLARGETLGVVGESGSGKSTLVRTLVGVHPATSGSILLDGRDVTKPSRAELRALRRRVQMVFQDPYASLNPRMTVGAVIADPLVSQGIGTPAEHRRRVAELLERVGLDASAAGRYPRDFSGGQRQRIGIARALAPEPDVLICDEPVSALDVSVQAQVVNLLADLQADLGLSMIFIAHDLAVVRQISHRIAVMRAGRVVETGPAEELCARPRHPYTRGLLAAVPSPVPNTVAAAAA